MAGSPYCCRSTTRKVEVARYVGGGAAAPGQPHVSENSVICMGYLDVSVQQQRDFAEKIRCHQQFLN